MGKSTKEVYGASGVFNGLWLDPDQILIVGWDPQAPEVEDLEDPDRLKGAPDKGLVESIATHGIRIPVTVRKVGDHVLAVDGRQRIRAARKANEALKDDARILVPCIVDKGGDLLTSMVITNEHRKEDGIIAKARKAQRMTERGQDTAAIAVAFGVSKATVKNWLSLMSADADIIQACEQGKIPPHVGYELARMTLPEQAKALKALLASGAAVKGDAGVANVRALRDGAEPPEAPSDDDGETKPRKPRGEGGLIRPGRLLPAAQIKGLALLFEPEEGEGYANEAEELIHLVLKVVTGEDDTAKGLKDFPEIQRKVRRAIKAKKEDK